MVNCERLITQLKELVDLTDRLSVEAYTNQLGILGGSTIGQHLRHIIEIMNCTLQGYESGAIDYEKRHRNHKIEQDITFAKSQLIMLNSALAKPDKSLLVKMYAGNGACNEIQTCYSREVLYNLEHTIHHMALIKVALRAMDLDVTTAQFGLAYSTIDYRKTVCAR